MQEILSTDAARSAFTVGNIAELNSHLNWDFWGPTMFVCFILLLTMLWNKDGVAYVLSNNFLARWRERQRMKAEREKKVREILSDNIQDAVDDAYLTNEITAEERQWAFETIGRLGFPDLRSRAKTLADEAKLKEGPAEEASLRTVHIL